MKSAERLPPAAYIYLSPCSIEGGARPLGTRVLRFTVFLSSAAMFGDCARHSESRKEQVAMIAQKIIYAKHAQQQWRRFITTPDARAFTFGTTRPDHFLSLFFCRRFGEEPISGAVSWISRRARKNSISRPMRSAISERTTSPMDSRER